MEVTVGPVVNEAELVAAFGLRRQVFVDELSVPADLESDEYDEVSVHVVAIQEGAVVATGRLVLAPSPSARIGRMVVVSPLRRCGIGSQVLACLEAQARLEEKTEVLLHAQLQVVGFYAHHGYKVHGGEFVEAGIRHVAMIKQL